MRRYALLVAASLAWLVSAAAAVHAERRVALVIGNAAYRHAGDLTNPRHDAEDMSAVLKALGWQVIDGLDLDKGGMEAAVRSFAGALTGASAGLFFYAGHGLQVNGTNYLVPVEAELSTIAALEFETIRLDSVQRIMESATKTSILFLDACRNNPLTRNLARALGTRSESIGKGLAPAESGVGTLISYSTQPGNVALDGKGRNSPYAGPLIEGIVKPGDDIVSVLTGVRNAVLKVTDGKQVPWENHALTAKFYVVPGGEKIEGAAGKDSTKAAEEQPLQKGIFTGPLPPRRAPVEARERTSPTPRVAIPTVRPPRAAPPQAYGVPPARRATPVPRTAGAPQPDSRANFSRGSGGTSRAGGGRFAPPDL